jgi:hypothetical protein
VTTGFIHVHALTAILLTLTTSAADPVPHDAPPDARALRAAFARQLQGRTDEPVAQGSVMEPIAPVTVAPEFGPAMSGGCAAATGDPCDPAPFCPEVADDCSQYYAPPPPSPWDVPAWQLDSPDWWTRDLSVLAGVHGFKGPFDQGRNANFGIQEGFNFGAPLGFWDWGFQVGANAVQSNFCGSEAFVPRTANRNQFFVTGGIFRRAREWGFQWGVTYDWLHDDYYAQTDLKQIRSDTGFIFPGGIHEIGYFGAYGTGGTSFVLLDRQLKYYIEMEPTDLFAFYYRRYFHGGGEGRAWIGFSGRGDGVIGAELRVPMGTGWALENRINYLIPKQGNSQEGLIQESWGVTIQLVWYPGQKAADVGRHPFRPMLNVADNTLFMTDTFVP